MDDDGPDVHGDPRRNFHAHQLHDASRRLRALIYGNGLWHEQIAIGAGGHELREGWRGQRRLFPARMGRQASPVGYEKGAVLADC